MSSVSAMVFHATAVDGALPIHDTGGTVTPFIAAALPTIASVRIIV
ncbi:MAG: hypothetical protein M3063_07550 [Actinomycetota bacterium]|nr:hypothetical protein [Actinomycetota bacterium]